MNKKIYLSFICMLAIALGIQTCVKKDFDLPQLPNVPEGSVLTVQGVKDLVDSKGTATDQTPDKKMYTFTEDKSMYGVISTSETEGNFYKKAYIQSAGSGIALTMKYGSGIALSAGDSVRIALKGLTVISDSEKYGYSIETLELDKNVFKQAVGVEVKPVDFNEISKVDISKHVGLLVKFNKVQVAEADLNKTWANAIAKEDQNINLLDPSNSGIIVRTSGYANFAGNKVPQGSGSVVGILSSYGTILQLAISDSKLIKMDNDRFKGKDIGTANATIADIKALYGGSSMTEITEEKIIEATVTATDMNGNLYKKIYVQDNTGGILLNINKKGLDSDYPVGTKLRVNLQSLYVDKYGEYKLGVPFTDSKTGQKRLGGIAEGDINIHISVIPGGSALSPQALSLDNLNDNMVGSLVTLSNVQFIDGDANQTYVTGGQNTNRTLTDKNGNKLIVRTSSFADFKAQNTPNGSGTITGIFYKFNTTYQMLIRDINEVSMNSPRFTVNSGGGGNPTPGADLTISALKAMYAGSGIFKITEDKTIEGVVTADDSNGNLYKAIYVEDATGGVCVKINKKKLNLDYPVGTKIQIKVKDLSLDKYGEIKLGVPFVDSKTGKTKLGGIAEGDIAATIKKVSGGSPLTAKVVTLAGLTDVEVGSLVKINEVQFVDAEVGKAYYDSADGYGTNRNLVAKDGTKLVVRTSSFAKYKNNLIPNKSGSVVGILIKYNKDYQLLIRNVNEVAMNDARF
ncbi:MAG: DUF5689 domain-containing protein [Bacteroidales bacterium]